MSPARTLLLMDDDTTTRELLLLLLTAEGWWVTPAASGEEALNILAAGIAPVVILSDLQMPGLCGTALASAIRLAAPSVPLIAMTATPRSIQPEGYDALLIKPFRPVEVELQYNAITQTTQIEQLRPAAATNQPEPILSPTVLEQLRSAMTPERLHALLTFVADDADVRVSRMRAAACEEDCISYRNEAHALKGSSSMVGAHRLSSLAARAEEEGLKDHSLGQWPQAAQFVSAMAEIRLMLKSLSRGVV